jgi:hypothetical protein
VFLEKSPPNVYRASMLQKHFRSSSFILMQRNPYAVAEGIRRRAQIPIERSIAHWIRCAQQQVENEKNLRRSVTIRYEDLSEDPARTRQRIIDLVPELADLNIREEVSAHTLEGRLRQPIVNYNARQIELLSAEDFVAVNAQLNQVPELMRHFGYEYMHVGGDPAGDAKS